MFVGIGPEKDTVVMGEQAFDYVLERSLHGTTEDQQEFREIRVSAKHV